MVRQEGGQACVLPDGRIIEYFVFGASLPSPDVLLCLHGHNTDGKMWQFLDAWGKKNNLSIVAPSLPGWGLTTARPGYHVEEWVKDVEYLLNEQLKIPAFHVMGASLGTVHCAAAASLFEPAHKVRNVVLYVAFAPEDKAAGHDPLKGSVLKGFSQLAPYPRTCRLLGKWVFNPMMRLFIPKDNNVWRSMRWQWEGAMDTTQLLFQPWPFPWKAIATRAGNRKVTVVSGTKDTMCPPHNQKRLVENIARSVLVEYDGDHGLGLEKPDMMISHLDQALLSYQ